MSLRDHELDIAQVLLAKMPELELDVDLFAGPFGPDQKQAFISIAQDDGDTVPYVSESQDLVSVTLEVTVAGDVRQYKEALDKARQVYGALHRARVSPYISILADTLPEYDGIDERDRPVFIFRLALQYVTAKAGEALVVLPPSGPLKLSQVELEAITFADGSILQSAPDTANLVTLTGNQTLSHKILEDLIVSGPIYPAEQGQSIGTEASPFGQLFLKGQSGAVPLELDQGGITNQRAFILRNVGLGTAGIQMLATSNQGWLDLGRSGQSWQLGITNRAMRFEARGRAYDPSTPEAWSFTDDREDRVTLAVTGRSSTHGAKWADLQQWRTHVNDTPEESVARVGPDGTIETVAGVVLRSPNGTRYRISVADDGNLTTEPAT